MPRRRSSYSSLRTCSFLFSGRRRHTIWNCDWSSDVCSSDLDDIARILRLVQGTGTALVELLAAPAAEPAVALRRPLGTFTNRSRATCRTAHFAPRPQIGRASCRERGLISEADVGMKKVQALG